MKEIIILLKLQQTLSIIRFDQTPDFISGVNKMLKQLPDSDLKNELNLSFLSIKILYYTILALEFDETYRSYSKICIDEIILHKTLSKHSEYAALHLYTVSLLESLYFAAAGKPEESINSVKNMLYGEYRIKERDRSLIRNFEFFLKNSGNIPADELLTQAKTLITKHMTLITDKLYDASM